MKNVTSVLGAIVLSASLMFVGCDERNEREGVAPTDQSPAPPVGPGGPANPERPSKTPEKTNR